MIARLYMKDPKNYQSDAMHHPNGWEGKGTQKPA